MSRIPETQMTPDGPAYEGRLLDRVGEPVVDQGAPFDIRTLVSRRGILGLVVLGAGAATLAACTPAATGSTGATTAPPTATPSATPSASAAGAVAGAVAALPVGEIPDETAGPYPGDGSNGPDILEQSGIVRSDLRTSLGGGATAAGVPMALNLYDGRWPHIHFEVYPNVDAITDASHAIATSQVALPQAACDVVYADAAYPSSASNLSRVSLDSDNVFGDDGGALELATATGDNSSGWTVSLGVRVDTATTPTGGAAPGRR